MRVESAQPNNMPRSRQISRDVAPPPPKTNNERVLVHQKDSDGAGDGDGYLESPIQVDEELGISQEPVNEEQAHYDALVASRKGPNIKKIPPFDKSRYPPCPACNGMHWLNFCGHFLHNMPYEQKIKLVKGESQLADVLTKRKMFPSDFLHLVQTGDRLDRLGY